MRILVYGINHAPELTGIGKYTGEMVQWLAARGHEVRVVAAPPYYPAWKVQEGYSASHYQVQQMGGARVYRCPLWVPEKSSGLNRVLHLASFMFTSLPVMLAQIFWRPQIIFMVKPTVLCAPATMLVAAATGATTWLHVQDFEVDAAFDLGILPSGGFVQWFAVNFERFFLRRFDRVSTISPNMMARARAKGVTEQQAKLFPNWVDIDAITPQRGENSFRRELGLQSDDIVLLYSGNMGMKQGLEVLPYLARHFDNDTHVKFLFCGDGAFRPQLEQLVSGLRNVTLLPLQPLDKLNDLLNAADIHLLPQRAGAADLVMPSKLTGMLASGRPVIATASKGTQLANVVEQCGIVVPAAEPTDELDGLYAAVRKLIADSNLRRTLGIAAREYAEQNMGRDNVLGNFALEIEIKTQRRA